MEELVEGNGWTPRKPTHTVFVHHKAHMARADIKPRTPHTRRERSTTERPRALWNC